MKIRTIVLLFSVLVLITGCTSSQALANKYHFMESGKSHLKSTIHIYRTNTTYHKFNPEKPFFYINDKLVGKLSPGNAVSIPVLPGEYTISVKESFAFMPGNTSGTVKLKVEKNKDYFIRYLQYFTGINGPLPVIELEGRKLQQVNEEFYFKRQ